MSDIRKFTVEYEGVDKGAVAEGQRYVKSTTEAERVTSSFNREMANLVRQVAVGVGATREQIATYDVLSGKYRVLAQSEKDRYVAVNASIDAQKQLIAATRQVAAAEDLATKMTEQWTRANALGTDASMQAVVAYERQSGGLKLLSDARYADLLAVAKHRDAVIAASVAETEAIARATEAQKAKQALRSSIPKAIGFASKLAVGVDLAAGAIGFEGAKEVIKDEAVDNALKLRLGVQGAREELDKLRQLALKPGLELDVVKKGDAKLMALGLTATASRRVMEQFGNAIAVAGGKAEDLTPVIDRLTTIDTRSKLTARSLTSLVTDIPQLKTLLKDAFGTDNLEKIAKQGLTGGQFLDKITDQLTKQKRALGGLGNDWKNATDAVKEFFKAAGSTFKDDLSKFLQSATKGINMFTTALEHLTEDKKKKLENLTLAALALGPALEGLKMGAEVFEFISTKAELLGTVVSQLGGVGAALEAVATGPVGIAIAAVAALVVAWKTDFGGIREFANNAISQIVGWWKANQGTFAQIISDFKDVIKSLSPVFQIFGDQAKFAFGILGKVIQATLEQASFDLNLFGKIVHGVAEFVSAALFVLYGNWNKGFAGMSADAKAFFMHVLDWGVQFINGLAGIVNKGIDLVNGLFHGLNAAKKFGGGQFSLLPDLPDVPHVLPGIQIAANLMHGLANDAERMTQATQKAIPAFKAIADVVGGPGGRSSFGSGDVSNPAGGGKSRKSKSLEIMHSSDNFFGVQPQAFFDAINALKNSDNDKALRDHAAALKTVNSAYDDLLAAQIRAYNSDPKEALALDLLHTSYAQLAPDIQNVIDKMVDLGKTQEAVTKLQADNDFLNMYDPRNGGSKPSGPGWAGIGKAITDAVNASGIEKGKSQLKDLKDTYDQLTKSETELLIAQMKLDHIPLNLQKQILDQKALNDVTQKVVDLRAQVMDTLSQGLGDGIHQGLTKGLKSGLAALAQDIDSGIFNTIAQRLTQVATKSLAPIIDKLIPLPGGASGATGVKKGPAGGGNLSGFTGGYGQGFPIAWLLEQLPWGNLFGGGGSSSGGGASTSGGSGDLPPVQHNAMGGMVRAGIPSWIDEGGSEIRDYGDKKLMTPNRDVRIHPNDKSLGMLGGTTHIEEKHFHFYAGAPINAVLRDEAVVTQRSEKQARVTNARNRG
jgi:hypothetical protein